MDKNFLRMFDDEKIRDKTHSCKTYQNIFGTLALRKLKPLESTIFNKKSFDEQSKRKISDLPGVLKNHH